MNCVLFAVGYRTAEPVPAIAEPPFGVTLNVPPATTCVWSRLSDQVTVTVRPSAATVAELSAGGWSSTTKERVALYAEASVELSTLFARQ